MQDSEDAHFWNSERKKCTRLWWECLSRAFFPTSLFKMASVKRSVMLLIRSGVANQVDKSEVNYDSLEGAAGWAQQTLKLALQLGSKPFTGCLVTSLPEAGRVRPSHEMEDWDIDTINEYCQQHFNGKFECVLAEGKGRIMISKVPVAQGDLLFEEPPLHIVAEDVGNEAFKLVQRLCKAEPSIFDYEPLWYWTALCSLTEEQLSPKPKIGSLKPVTALQQKRLLCLFHEPVDEASDAVKKLVKQLGLSTPAVLVEELLQAWILNCFEHSEDPLGYSAYFASSFVSHSCGANGIWSEGDDGLHILRARRDIAPGDEVCISYLPEDVLLHSAEERKKSLKSTKQFDCTCERCAPVPPDEVGWDPCRGFRCPKCGSCGVFHQLVFEEGKGLQGPLQGTACRECKAKVSAADAKRLLRAEELLEAELKKLDAAVEERRSIHKVLKENDVQRLLSMIGDHEGGLVGPQHWLCDRLWEHLQNWSKQAGKWSDELRYLDLRTDYQRKAYFPGPSGTLAWTLEHQADRLLEMLGHGSPTKKVDAPQDVRQKLGNRLVPIYQESGAILKLMFGAHHEYFRAVENKITTSKAFVPKI
ncbi:unnamed protein product [Symbiodinium sp. KB8]|nr:unnamed protein product [Symbiodinium sp. KB8]